jgi:hypothetical protein
MRASEVTSNGLAPRSSRLYRTDAFLPSNADCTRLIGRSPILDRRKAESVQATPPNVTMAA